VDLICRLTISIWSPFTLRQVGALHHGRVFALTAPLSG
jgi:hypothetical protein